MRKLLQELETHTTSYLQGQPPEQIDNEAEKLPKAIKEAAADNIPELYLITISQNQ